jgi:hypothetical protein
MVPRAGVAGSAISPRKSSAAGQAWSWLETTSATAAFAGKYNKRSWILEHPAIIAKPMMKNHSRCLESAIVSLG